MPRLSRWALRAALVWMVLGYAVGALLLAAKGTGAPAWAWRLLPLHAELLLLGWSLQLAMGVAFWILPRWRHSRGDARPAWLALGLLNAGLLLVGLGAALAAPGWLLLAGRAAEALAVAAFALHAWPRVKPPAGASAPPAAAG